LHHSPQSAAARAQSLLLFLSPLLLLLLELELELWLLKRAASALREKELMKKELKWNFPFSLWKKSLFRCIS
jgi:hypothetical protein